MLQQIYTECKLTSYMSRSESWIDGISLPLFFLSNLPYMVSEKVHQKPFINEMHQEHWNVKMSLLHDLRLQDNCKYFD